MDASNALPDPQAKGRHLREAKRVGCRDMARNRAARYARRRHIPKLFWPLLTAFILLGLLLKRRGVPSSFGGPARDGKSGNASSVQASESCYVEAASATSDTGSAVRGSLLLDHRPAMQFLARDVSQVLAFLIRNRGRLDNHAVRMKWELLDRFSLPLAVYLRDIEAANAWGDLEREVSAAPPEATAMSAMAKPRSSRHRKIHALLPEWTERGDTLLAAATAEEPSSALKPELHDNEPSSGLSVP